MVNNIIQTNYQRYQSPGFPGAPSRPGACFELLKLYVPASGESRGVRPGDAVYWNATNNAVALPTNAAQRLQVIGPVIYEVGSLATSSGFAIPASGNSDVGVQYNDGDTVKVMTFGYFWAITNTVAEFDSYMIWDHSANHWQVGSIPTTGNNVSEILPRRVFSCVSPAASANSLCEIMVNGRVF